MISKKKALQVRKPSKGKGLKTKNRLLDDLRHMIDMTKQAVASTVNAGLTLLYWHVGDRIHKEILQDARTEYGLSIVVTVSRQLSWSHFLTLIPLKDSLQRDFYAEMCRIEKMERPRFTR